MPPEYPKFGSHRDIRGELERLRNSLKASLTDMARQVEGSLTYADDPYPDKAALYDEAAQLSRELVEVETALCSDVRDPYLRKIAARADLLSAAYLYLEELHDR